MGKVENTNHMQADKLKILKEAGKLPKELDKDIDKDYQPVDHHELDHHFDKHMLSLNSPVTENAEGVSSEELTESGKTVISSDDLEEAPKSRNILRKNRK